MKLHGTMTINAKGHLEIGNCDVVDLANQYGTPLYVIDEKHFRDNCRQYYNAFTEQSGSKVLYASKALLTTAICRIIHSEGLGLDVVSGGEIHTALKADYPMEKVFFHGNNKTLAELEMALDAKIGRIVVDNYHEMQMLNAIAVEKRQKVDIHLRITPGVEAHTHEYIQTGQIDSKFGFTLSTGKALEAAKKVAEYPQLNLVGMHCHIGSQIFELKSYQHAATVMLEFVEQVKKEAGIELIELNLGGGFGIYYTAEDEPADIKEYADLVVSTVKDKAQELGLVEPQIFVEPGRSIAGTAGTTLYTIGSTKEIENVRKYVAVDGGMTDNIRPALYQAKYEAMIANKGNEPAAEVVSITGKCCESGDMLIWDIELPKAEAGDILAVSSTGAYGYTMSNNYNRLTRPGMVLVYEGNSELIVRPETYEDLTAKEIIPERLK
ncbi:diaminopimelate decarboxylase [Desulfitispora alkaliphila]|uniref:diaminopimelate decarboxylase n=1 Tax=Desulfitispora alkaliphila TaxID=622674 RepID=UPI003D25370A